jgi:hypothetical protein
MAEEVQYRLTLNDELTPKLGIANEFAEQLEHSMGRVIERVAEYATIYEAIDFVKDSYKDFEQFHQSEVQLENTLKNVGQRSGETKEQLIGMATAGRNASEFTKQQFLEAETSLLRFHNINSATYKETLSFAADIAQSRHEDINSVAGMLGAIVGDPGEAGRRLRQFDIILSPYQQKWLRAQQEAGHLAVAQQFVFDQLKQHGFEGAAALAAMEDPAHGVNAALEDLKENLGSEMAKAVKELAPYLIELIHDFEELMNWGIKNKEVIIRVAEAIGYGVLAFKAMSLIIVPLIEGLETLPAVEGEVAAGMTEIGEASTVALGPLGLLAAAIGAVAFAYESVADAEADANKNHADFMTKIEKDENSNITHMADILEKNGMKSEAASKRAKQLELDNINATLADNLKSIQAITGDSDEDEAKRKALYGQQEDLLHQKDAASNYTAPIQAAKSSSSLMPGTQAAKVEGPKVVNINVHIDNMVKEFSVKTTNITGSAAEVKRLFTQYLVDAVNDAEILAGQEH